jgi:YfiH family protein
MPMRSVSDISFYQFESFESLPVEHAIFTREGGVSPSPWDSLNVGGTVGDDPERVRINQERALDAINRKASSLFDVWQVHSSDYVFAAQPRDGKPFTKADIVLTDNPGVTLFMRFADCVPIMLVDPQKKAVAIVHAGWLGTVRGAAISAVSALQDHCGSNPRDLFAGLGPSIGPDHYIVGKDVLEYFEETFPRSDEEHFQVRHGEFHLNLWSANESQLRSAGVERIEVAQICTACNLRRWFSHRAENGQTGRFGAMLALSG